MGHDAVEGDELVVVLPVVDGDQVDSVLEEDEDLVVLELGVVLDEEEVEFEFEGGVGREVRDDGLEDGGGGQVGALEVQH